MKGTSLYGPWIHPELNAHAIISKSFKSKRVAVPRTNYMNKALVDAYNTSEGPTSTSRPGFVFGKILLLA